MSFFKKIEDEAKDLTQKIENEASEIGQKIEDGVQEIKDDMELDMADPNAPVDEPPAATEEQIQAVMEKYDREANVRHWQGVPRIVVRYMLVGFAIYSILLNFGLDWETRIERASFVGILVFLIFIVFPSKKGGGKRLNYIPWYDIILAIIGGGSYFYFVFNLDKIITNTIRLEPIDLVIGLLGVIVTLEGCRRAVGIPIVVVSSAFIIYMLGFTGKPLAINVYNLFYTTEGVIGTPIRACSTFIVLFVIFGAFLERTGISQFFIELANSIAGGSSGGPAKVAVISSALCGMVSGSSVGNTVTTGSVTIPMMKKTGYRPEFAGAVEAAASTGGQIMPPVMGAAAFLMIDYVGVPYSSIIVRAILPAALYFLGIFIAVHLEAKRTGLLGIPKDQLPVFKQLIKKIYLLLPLVVLVVMVSTNLRTMAFSAAMAILFAVVVANMESNRIVGIIGCVALLAYIFLPSFASLPAIVLTILVVLGLLATAGGTLFKGAKMNPGVFMEAMANGGKSCISIIAACGIAGCVAGCIAMTGLASQIISFIIRIAGSHLIVALFFTMLRPHPHQDGRAHHRGPLLRVLLRHRGGHHPAGGPGGLRGLGHRQVRSHEDGRQRDEARHRGVHRALRVRHGSHHDVRGRGALVPGGADLPDLRHRHLRRGVGPGGLHVHGYALVHADRGHRGRLAAAGPVHLDGHRGPRHRGGGHRLPVPAVQEKESRRSVRVGFV